MIFCNYCDLKFSLRKNLYRHIRTQHHVEPVISIGEQGLGKLKCGECSNIFPNHASLRQHVINDHEVDVPHIQIKFKSFKDFISWKNDEEKSTKSQYTKHGQSRILKNENTKHYYFCHRSGRAKLLSSIRRRKSRSQGSCKIGSQCISTITATESKDCVDVSYYPTHFGHEMDLGYLKLSTEDREQIAVKLSQGVSFDVILDDIGDNIKNKIERIHLLTIKELRNIESSFHLSKKENPHDNDAISVELWVSSMQEHEDNPVIFFKPQNVIEPSSGLEQADFCIIILPTSQREIIKKFGNFKICIDSTHGTNADDYHLTTLIVIDEFGEGYPTAFCISNRVNAKTITLFFEKILKSTWQINCETIMTDDNPVYFNAWKAIMGDCQHWLCTWHVDRNWRKNLIKIVNLEKRAEAYRTIRVLLEHQDVSTFDQLLESILEQFSSDDQLKAFGEYFRKQYSSRASMWAYCHRKFACINTNMSLEALHKIISYTYFQGKQIGLDKGISSLMQLIRDKAYERLIKLSTEKQTSKITGIWKRHQNSLQFTNGEIDYDNELNAWVCESDTIKHIIRKECSCNDKCKLVCEECETCIHVYSCTCADYFVHCNMCKHIHGTILFIKANKIGEIAISGNIDAIENYEIETEENIENSELLEHMSAEVNMNCGVINKFYNIVGMIQKNKFNAEDIKKMDAFANTMIGIGDSEKKLQNRPIIHHIKVEPAN